MKQPAAKRTSPLGRHSGGVLAASARWSSSNSSGVSGQGSMATLTLLTAIFRFSPDDEIAASLAAIRSALTSGGRFAFETRNPCVRAWDRWTPDQVREVITPAGVLVRMQRTVDSVEGDLVRFHHTFTSPAWDHPETSRTTPRFLDAPSLASLLSRAGFAIEAQYGDWDRSPLTPASPEIITVAR